MSDHQLHQQQQQQQMNNRLSSDWFYSSVMLADRLDIGENSGSVGFDIGQLKANSQSPPSCNSPLNSEIMRNYGHASNNMYPNATINNYTSTSTAYSLSSSLTSPTLQSPDSKVSVSDDRSVQILDLAAENNCSVESQATDTFCKSTRIIGTDSDFILTQSNSMHYANNNSTLQCRRGGKLASSRSRSDRRIGIGKLRLTCSSSCSNRKNDNMRRKKVEEGGDDEVDAPPRVLCSHSITNSCDQMKWDCGTRWPPAKRTETPTSPHAVLVDAHGKSSAPAEITAMTTTNVRHSITAPAVMDSSAMDIVSGFCGSSQKLIQNNGYDKVESSMFIGNGGDSDEVVNSKAKVQSQDNCSFTDANVTAKASTVGAASAATSAQSSSAVVPRQRLSSTTALAEGSSLSSSPTSMKIPIKKRIHHHGSPVPYVSDSVANNISLNSTEHQSSAMTSAAAVTSSSATNAFWSCTQVIPVDTALGDVSTAVSAICSETADSNHGYDEVTSPSNHVAKAVAGLDALPVLTNNLSEAELISLLCQNVCSIEHIVAQDRIASGTLIQHPHFPLTLSSNEQQPQTNSNVISGSVIAPDQKRLQQQQQHIVENESRRSVTAENIETRRYHPYAILTTTAAAAATTTTTSGSSSTAVSSSSTPSQADLKQKHLRSLAPVLYDLLSDDCDSENCRKSTESMNYSILKNYVEPSMDSYFRSLSLLAATASLPIVTNKLDQLPMNYIDYFTLQQYNLLFGAAPVTSNLLYNSVVTTSTTNPGGTLFPDLIPFTSDIDQHSNSNAMNGSCGQASQQQAMTYCGQ